MGELERLLVHYGCGQFCYNHNDCNNCWFKEYVQYELGKLKSQPPICKSETKLNVIW